MSSKQPHIDFVEKTSIQKSRILAPYWLSIHQAHGPRGRAGGRVESCPQAAGACQRSAPVLELTTPVTLNP